MFDTIWKRPPFWPYVILMAFQLFLLFRAMSSPPPLKADTVGAICISAGGFFMGGMMFFVSSYYYSLRRSLQWDSENVDWWGKAVMDQIQQTSYLTVKSEMLKRAQSEPPQTEEAEQ